MRWAIHHQVGHSATASSVSQRHSAAVSMAMPKRTKRGMCNKRGGIVFNQ
jgi:hypothetical protein